MKEKRVKIFSGVLLLLVFLVAGAILSTSYYMMIAGKTSGLKLFGPKICIDSLLSNRLHQLIMLALICVGICVFFALCVSSAGDFKANVFRVTPHIYIPKPYGQGQHGTAWWMTDGTFKKTYSTNSLRLGSSCVKQLMKSGYNDLPKKLRPTGSVISAYLNNFLQQGKLELGGTGAERQPSIAKFKSGGLVVGMSKSAFSEKLHFVDDDTHVLVLGATRCGKTRCLVLPTIVNLALGGENIVASDPKGELFQYTAPFLERMGYRVIVLDYKVMEKSMAYNLLQPIIDSFNSGNTNKAIQQARDMANILVGEKSGNGEPIWHNGEISVVAAVIIAVVYDNMKIPQNQNLTYVYEFFIRMCACKGQSGMPLQRYLVNVGEDHPANILLAQANIAPEKTRGSFYTAAASTLSIWTDRELYHISKKSDFDLLSVAKEKTALFIILPDGKQTFYAVASLIVSQLYEQLTEYADITLGTGRLPHRINFVLDEFGNFVELSNFSGKLTVAGGRGVRFMLFIQNFKQLNEKYNDNVAETIKSNCDTWVYLSANDKDSKEEIVHKLGPYTTSSYSLSASRNSNGSESMNLISRTLLTSEEVGRIARPYQLVCGNGGQRVSYAPDLSKFKTLNKMLGLGNIEHNQTVRSFRDDGRKVYADVSQPIVFVDPIWRKY